MSKVMIVTEDKIKQILGSNDEFRRVLDMMAPLEIDRLAQLIVNIVKEAGQNSSSTKQTITDALEESKDIFGNLNLTEMLNLDDLLKQIYQT